MDKFKYNDRKQFHFRELAPGDRFLFDGMAWEKVEPPEQGDPVNAKSLEQKPGESFTRIPGAYLVTKLKT